MRVTPASSQRFTMLDDLVGDDAVILYDDHLIELADLYEQQGRFDEAADLHARYCAALEIPNRDEEVREARLPMAVCSQYPSEPKWLIFPVFAAGRSTIDGMRVSPSESVSHLTVSSRRFAT